MCITWVQILVNAFLALHFDIEVPYHFDVLNENLIELAVQVLSQHHFKYPSCIRVDGCSWCEDFDIF